MAGSKVFIGHVLMAAHAHMPSVTIAPGVEMPMLAFGTSFNSFADCSVQDMVEQFLALGGRHIDTAYDYHTQSDVGRAIASTAIPREEIFVTTKLDPQVGRQEAIDLVNRTCLAELGLDYIDLVLIHFPCQPGHPDDCGDAFEEERIETWKGLMDLREAGVIRAAGVSNWNAKHIQNLVDAGLGAPAVNQVEWHLGYHDEDLFSAMATNDVKTMAWSALAGLTSQAFGHPGISLGDPELKALAAPYNASTAEVALRWETQRGVTPVTSSCSASHLASNLASFDVKLSDDDIAALDALTASGAPLVVV